MLKLSQLVLVAVLALSGQAAFACGGQSAQAAAAQPQADTGESNKG